ncbi:CHC2 zinc finger domain-containing protein [Chloroflexota bacterium]
MQEKYDTVIPKDHQSILFINDSGNAIQRFSIPELRRHIHRCNINASVAGFLGNEEEAGFHRWLSETMQAALHILLSHPKTSSQGETRTKTIQDIKSNTNIVEIASHYLPLRKSGKRFTGLCPFHSEKHPSFTVYPENQSWYCFSCNRGGDVIDFIRLIENTDFQSALSILGGMA